MDCTYSAADLEHRPTVDPFVSDEVDETLRVAVPSFRPDLGDAWQVSKLYWPALPRQVIVDAMAAMSDEQRAGLFGDLDVAEAPFLVDDELVTTRFDGRDYLDHKLAAMRAHASQIDLESPFFAMSAVAGPEALGYEFYRIAIGQARPERLTGVGVPPILPHRKNGLKWRKHKAF